MYYINGYKYKQQKKTNCMDIIYLICHLLLVIIYITLIVGIFLPIYLMYILFSFLYGIVNIVEQSFIKQNKFFSDYWDSK